MGFRYFSGLDPAPFTDAVPVPLHVPGTGMNTTEDPTAGAFAGTPPALRARVRRALEGILDERELYRAIHRAASLVMETDGFYVAVYDPSTDTATVVYWADRDEGHDATVSYPGSRSEVIRSGRPTLVEDRLESRSLMVLGEEEGRRPTRSAVSAPLVTAAGIAGAISAQSHRPGAYAEHDMEVLQAIADLAAAALERIRTGTGGDRTSAKAREARAGALEGLVGLTDVEEVLEAAVEGSLAVVPADGAVFWLLDGNNAWAGAVRGESAPDRDFSVPLVGEGARRLVEDREPLLLSDAPRSDLVPATLRSRIRARSALAVPAVAGGEVVGIVSVGAGSDRSFTSEETGALLRYAAAVARALQAARHTAHLESLSLADPLTGLPNRRHVELHLAREFAAARRGRDLSVVLFDVDNFRRYNDTLGRVAGDEVLRTLAEVLSAETRAMNLVARLGGDEFLAVLSDTPLEGARLHAERVEERVARHSGLGPHGITISTGVAAFSEEMGTPQDLMRAADRDLRGARPAEAWE